MGEEPVNQVGKAGLARQTTPTAARLLILLYLLTLLVVGAAVAIAAWYVWRELELSMRSRSLLSTLLGVVGLLAMMSLEFGFKRLVIRVSRSRRK